MEERKWSLEEDYHLPSPIECKGSWIIPFARFYASKEPTTFLLALVFSVESTSTISVQAIDASLLRDASPFLEDISWRPFWRKTLRRELPRYSALLSCIIEQAKTLPDEWAVRYRQVRSHGAKWTF